MGRDIGEEREGEAVMKCEEIRERVLDVAAGRLPFGDFWRSLRSYHIEAVFNREDPVPGIVECALIPYLTVKRGF